MGKKGRIEQTLERAYERFLELPVLAVLVVLWFAGTAVLVFLILTFYLFWSTLVRMLLGS